MSQREIRKIVWKVAHLNFPYRKDFVGVSGQNSAVSSPGLATTPLLVVTMATVSLEEFQVKLPLPISTYEKNTTLYLIRIRGKVEFK